MLPKIPLLILVFCSLAIPSFPQSSRVLGSFVYQNASYNYELVQEGMNTYSFRVTSAQARGDQGAAADSADQNADQEDVAVYFSEFRKNVFEAIFVAQMAKIFGHDSTSQQLKEKATEVFFTIQTRLNFVDDEPVTAYLILRKDTIYSFLKTNLSPYYDGPLSCWLAKHYVKRVSVETEYGAIKNIIVQVVRPDRESTTAMSPRSYLVFKNNFPISISGKFDSDKFADINLYCYNCSGIQGLSRYVRLSDLLLLDIVLENDKEDYSPSNRTITLTPASNIQELKKEQRSKILEVSAFTDLAGLDQDQPNGLIQIEAKRRITVSTRSRLLSGGKSNEDVASQVDLSDFQPCSRPTVKGKTLQYVLTRKSSPTSGQSSEEQTITINVSNRKFRSPYFAVISGFEPRLLFSKLEESNRVLDSTMVSDGKLSSLRVYQHQLWSFGATIDLFELSFPQVKLNWKVLRFGAYYFRAGVDVDSDSTENSDPLNNSYLQFGTSVIFRPDSRWGAAMGFDIIRPTLWNSQYEYATGNMLLQPYFDGYLKTSDQAKLFFRFRWIWERHERENNFVQLPVGYTMNLFAANK